MKNPESITEALLTEGEYEDLQAILSRVQEDLDRIHQDVSSELRQLKNSLGGASKTAGTVGDRAKRALPKAKAIEQLVKKLEVEVHNSNF